MAKIRHCATQLEDTGARRVSLAERLADVCAAFALGEVLASDVAGDSSDDCTGSDYCDDGLPGVQKARFCWSKFTCFCGFLFREDGPPETLVIVNVGVTRD